MKRTQLTIAAAATVLVAAAAAVTVVVTRPVPPPAPAVPDVRRARDLTAGYRGDAIAQLPATFTYREAFQTYLPCPGPGPGPGPGSAGRYVLSSRFDLSPGSGAAGAAAVDRLRGHWRELGYRILNDNPGIAPQLVTENPADGFRIGISQRPAQFLRLAITSPCLAAGARPAQPVLPQDLATARLAYRERVAGVLARLAGDVAALRTALARNDIAGARAAWLTAQLRWDTLGAAYGGFGDHGAAIDGLPQGLPGGVADPGFTGLHRIEHGLWHGEPAARLVPLADGLAADVAGLRAGLDEAMPEPVDLPLRAHEVLEDAQRFHLTGLTDLGAGAGLAETDAALDATSALLGELSAPILQRRPALLPKLGARLAALRNALRANRTATGWRSPAELDRASRQRVDAALGAALETLAEVPGLLEVSGS